MEASSSGRGEGGSRTGVAPLRMGTLEYVNVLPVVHFLERAVGPERSDRLQIVSGPPERLNGLLASRSLDLSPISSVEYARHQDRYLIVDDLCIASRGEVRSVVLFSRLPLEDLQGGRVSICRATATSRVLMRVMLERFVGVAPCYAENGLPSDLEAGRADALLLIGDDALAFRRRWRECGLDLHEHDLGRLWWEATGLPMVFAMWAVRVQARSHPLLRVVRAGLRRSRERGMRLPAPLLDEAARRTGMGRRELEQYYRGLHFVLDDESCRGLLTFYRHAAELGLCPSCTRLRFLQGSPVVAHPVRAGSGEHPVHGGAGHV